jgi:hypothetical protein
MQQSVLELNDMFVNIGVDTKDNIIKKFNLELDYELTHNVLFSFDESLLYSLRNGGERFH